MCQSKAATGGSGSAAQERGGRARCIGIVIQVPEPLAARLKRWRASFGDPLAAVVPPHITLVTTTPASDWEEALQHVRETAGSQEKFEVTLRGTGSFRPLSPVVYVNVDAGFDACVQLHEKLQRGPLAHSLDFPFHPHVTVAHDVSNASMDSAMQQLKDLEEAFLVSSMGVFEHEESGVWTLREELKFGRRDS